MHSVAKNFNPNFSIYIINATFITSKPAEKFKVCHQN